MKGENSSNTSTQRSVEHFIHVLTPSHSVLGGMGGQREARLLMKKKIHHYLSVKGAAERNVLLKHVKLCSGNGPCFLCEAALTDFTASSLESDLKDMCVKWRVRIVTDGCCLHNTVEHIPRPRPNSPFMKPHLKSFNTYFYLEQIAHTH